MVSYCYECLNPFVSTVNRLLNLCPKCRRTLTRERNMARYARKRQVTPKWADKDKIKEIYRNYPKGYHVDHIIPLRGECVSGLHVEGNLQYLPAIENIKKGNKYNSSLIVY